jgi:F420H(2)-dependent quinone reductase
MPLTGEYEPSTDERTRVQAETYERTNGAEANTWLDLPVIVVTVLGRKSGKLRKFPLMRVEHDGEYALVASMGGAPKHPTWYHSVVGADIVELQDGAERHDYTVRETEGADRDAWWARSVEAYPPYADYQQKTDRVIPVFLLEPASA